MRGSPSREILALRGKYLHLAHKLCLCDAPFALYGSRRDPHDLRRLADGESGKIAEFDDASLLWIEPGEFRQQLVDEQVVSGLLFGQYGRMFQRNCLDYNHAMGEVLESEGQIVGEPACVRLLDGNGGWVMLEDRINELKVDPRFRDSVPSPPKIARGQEDQIRENFDRIARGEVQVVK